MDCPACKKPFIIIERQQIELDYCLSCHGVWFDQDEFLLMFAQKKMEQNFNAIDQGMIKTLSTELQALKTIQQTPKVLEPFYSCPRCKNTMEKIEITDKKAFYIDTCPKGHGFWFEQYETEQAFEYLLNKNCSDDSALEEISRFVEETIQA